MLVVAIALAVADACQGSFPCSNIVHENFVMVSFSKSLKDLHLLQRILLQPLIGFEIG